MNTQNKKLSGNSSTVKKKKDFLKAAAKNRGNITKSAKAANIGRRTYYHWIDEDLEFAAQFEEVLESFLDFVIDQGMQLIAGIPIRDKDEKVIGWKLKPDASTIQFYLRTLGRRRGFTEHSELDVSAQVPFIYDSDAVSRLIEESKKL